MSGSDVFLSLFPEFSSFMPHLEYRRYPKGGYVVRAGDSLNHLFFFLSGEAWIVRHLANGKEFLHQVSVPGDFIGDVEYFLGEEALCSVQCIHEASVAMIPFRVVEKLEASQGGINRILGKMLATRLKSSSLSSARNSGYSLLHRLAHYLYSIDSKELPHGRMDEVSELFGTSRRHLRRVITQLEEMGALHREKGRVVVKNRELLKDLSAEVDP